MSLTEEMTERNSGRYNSLHFSFILIRNFFNCINKARNVVLINKLYYYSFLLSLFLILYCLRLLFKIQYLISLRRSVLLYC